VNQKIELKLNAAIIVKKVIFLFYSFCLDKTNKNHKKIRQDNHFFFGPKKLGASRIGFFGAETFGEFDDGGGGVVVGVFVLVDESTVVC